MLTLVPKDSVKISDHFDVCAYSMVLEIINQMAKNQKSSLIVWNTVAAFNCGNQRGYEATGRVQLRGMSLTYNTC